ncbi:CBS domain-containing protein [Nitrosophilus alvini]|uniref:CBS domain-containing protein n=1 Tax=Nitrosophilus alvini TaxID=2714855 RepID=UPI001909EFB5|nr:CBS domain-containing protein [Nitrosophilus alvini]
MVVKEIMKKEVATISPLASLKEALQKMKDLKVKSLVVEKVKKSDAYGIITYSDIIKAIIAEEGGIDLFNVYDIYSKPVITISEEIDVKYAAQMMIKYHVRRLLITNGEEIRGILSMSDMLDALWEEMVELKD